MSIELTAVLLALVAMLANGEYFLGSSMLSRPLITCTLAGLVMGDITQGIIIGASLELALVGSFSIGASIPPELISGSVLGTAFAIGAGKSAEIALPLCLPIASLVLLVKNLCFLFILPYFVHKADKYASEGNGRGMDLMNLFGGFISINLPIGLVVGFSYLFGSSAINTLLDAIPIFIIDGLSIATGLLPAFGFAMLMKIMIKKNNATFFIFGFALAVYMNVPVTGVAIFGACLALVLTGYSAFNGKKIIIEQGNETQNNNSGNMLSAQEINYENEEF
ncbi:MAG: PTS sugar transporter subunit IIC [Gilliamella sp.]|uniref:PTS mannose/fructose/sorbose/N-acetylgalactosamine transporter subunit IIC n=1 Tax=Gilliamella sp. TaxID=1891236 RepID=UPI0026255E18|nr:PTS sugar transporter subunit IIC [Gilliamella sp.]MCO6552081.1 PTS sugar transporter subunit IIC [Gilliamella sp.]MCO6559975.1 PTS sugar transporter subunit IIC [Gilliamella sp.]